MCGPEFRGNSTPSACWCPSAAASPGDSDLDARRAFTHDDADAADLHLCDLAACGRDPDVDPARTSDEHALRVDDRAGLVGSHEPILDHEAARRTGRRSGGWVLVDSNR